jgi:hypothetical protein
MNNNSNSVNATMYFSNSNYILIKNVIGKWLNELPQIIRENPSSIPDRGLSPGGLHKKNYICIVKTCLYIKNWNLIYKHLHEY